MANNRIVVNDNKDKKLAPIFATKSKDKINNNINVCDNNKNNKLKRKKKLKNENNKVAKKFNSCTEDNFPSVEYRRSKRLRDKTFNEEKVVTISDIEEKNSEKYFNENYANEQNDDLIVVNVIGENSNTIDYWNDFNGVKQLDQNKEIDEIEVVFSQTCNSPRQESVKTPPASISSVDGQKECLLWTEKYKPSNSSEVIGHKIAVNRLKSWLEDWNNSNNRVENNSEDDSYQSLDKSDTCLLICGPTGFGKTSLVYAVAEELKYEVLELNASMRRNPRIISKIVSEATQSHHMQRNSDSQTSQTITIQSMFSQKSDCNVNDSEVRVEKIVKPIKKSKSKAKPKGILNYFTKQNTTKSVKSCPIEEEIEIIDNKEETGVLTKCETVMKLSDKLNDSMICSPKVLSIASNSLILFDDVDVMIDEEFNGFWNAVNKINEITKKPVILTATQFIPYIKDCVNRLQVLTLNIPDHNETVNALKNICDKETDSLEEQISFNLCEHLTNSFNHDIRRCINELQFGWNQWKNFETQSNETIEENPNPISYYDSLIFSDIMEKNFNILSNSENRKLWMNCKPTLIEDDNQSICLAKEVISDMNELNDKINKSCTICLPNESIGIESEYIESISESLAKNTDLRTILLDYCPYLSLICQAESIRQSELVNHSRRSRRFMHHLDSIGFYINNSIKNKLISTFIPQSESHVSDENLKLNETIDLGDNDFYD